MQSPSYLERVLSELTLCIEADAEPRNGWIDCWCHECDTSECIQGTPRQLAEKVHKLGWSVDNLKLFNLICPACADYQPELTDEEELAELRYEEWKESRLWL